MLSQPSIAARAALRDVASDPIAGASPAIMRAIVHCHTDPAQPYGGAPWTGRVQQPLCDLFAQDLGVYLVSTGTGADPCLGGRFAPALPCNQPGQ